MAVALSLWVAKINPVQAITSLRQIWDTVALYFRPDFTSDRSNLISGTIQSASVAMLATSVGFLLAVPIGLLAARNVSDKWIYRRARGFLVVVRAVPELILAIVFVVAVGLGLGRPSIFTPFKMEPVIGIESVHQIRRTVAPSAWRRLRAMPRVFLLGIADRRHTYRESHS